MDVPYKLYNGDCLEIMPQLEAGSVDCIFSDPPYQYLKNQKIDVSFDEVIFFNECKRVLKNKGFIVLFGRGSSFYRWNTRLDELGFIFKEEVVWNKNHNTSPLMALHRIHETVSIHTKKDGKIFRSKIPYLEMKQHDLSSIVQDIKRLMPVMKNPKSLKAVQDFLETNQVILEETYSDKHITSTRKGLHNVDRNVAVLQMMEQGATERSIIRTDRKDDERFTKFGISNTAQTGDRNVNVIQAIEFGMTEKSIIEETRNHYQAIHPTEKPVRLLERILSIVTRHGDIVLDPFAGSFSTGVAALNTGRKFIGIELLSEYFALGEKRIRQAAQQPALFHEAQQSVHLTASGAGGRGDNPLQSSFIADDPSANNGGR